MIESLPGHEGLFVERPASRGVAAGCAATCTCGWTDEMWFPVGEEGRKAAEEQWWRVHALPAVNDAPPHWLKVKSDVLREQVEILSAGQPRAALQLLAEVDRWRRAETDRAVASARAHGMSWAAIGGALGISRQSAHERFGGTPEA